MNVGSLTSSSNTHDKLSILIPKELFSLLVPVLRTHFGAGWDDIKFSKKTFKSNKNFVCAPAFFMNTPDKSVDKRKEEILTSYM